MKFNLFRIYLVFLLTLSGSNAHATSYDTTFYQRIKTVVVQGHSKMHREGLSGKVEEFVLRAKFPIPAAQLDQLLIEATKVRLNSHKGIVVASADEFGRRYLDARELDTSQIYLYADLLYWRAGDFSPKLDHDLISLQIRTKMITPGDGSSRQDPVTRKIKGTAIERYSPLILRVVPSDVTQLGPVIADAFGDSLQEFIFP